MTKAAALHSFFNSFGIPGHPDTSVPGDQELPYLTYTPVFDFWGNSASMIVNLWYRTTDDAVPNQKAQEIAESIGSGRYLLYDGGAVLLTRGSPWCQSLTDDADESIKRRYINIIVEYLTLN